MGRERLPTSPMLLPTTRSHDQKKRRRQSGGSGPLEALRRHFETRRSGSGFLFSPAGLSGGVLHTSGRSSSWKESRTLVKHKRATVSLQSRTQACRRRSCTLAVPLQLLHIRAALREDADAPAVRRPSVQVEGQLVGLRWLTAGQARRPGASCHGSKVVDSQEVSRLRRQAKDMG